MKHLDERGRHAEGGIKQLEAAAWTGTLAAATSNTVQILGLAHHLSLGERVRVEGKRRGSALAEIISVDGNSVKSMTFSPIGGIGVGATISAPLEATFASLSVSESWIGRIVDPLGHPLDSGVPLSAAGGRARATQSSPLEANRRARLGERLSLGVKALDLFATCRSGQRVGLFAGSGVGKSTLLGMLARNVSCDVTVIALVGERGREVREFVDDDLGDGGLSKSVVVVATSDASPLMRREAAYAAMTIAEYFRDTGRHVLLLMDSVTRFCQALREIALSAGEPPASRGYPPTVFSELPRLFERAGPGKEGGMPTGQITAFFTVLVDGDDHNEPVADSVRGLLDGHIVLDRKIAERGRFPAVDIGRSLSRAAYACNSAEENRLAARARRILATCSEMEDLVRLGAYRAGADIAVDEALAMGPGIEAMLNQDKNEQSTIEESFVKLESAIKSTIV